MIVGVLAALLAARRLLGRLRVPVAAGRGRAGRVVLLTRRDAGRAAAAAPPYGADRRTGRRPPPPTSEPPAPTYEQPASDAGRVPAADAGRPAGRRPRRRSAPPRASAARSCSGSRWRWSRSPRACSASSTWPARRSPARPTRPWRSASPALMLLVGAFWGRAGGLILLGLVSTAGPGRRDRRRHWDGTTLHATPGARPPHVQASYDISTGELVLDLTDVRDLAALDGRTIHVSGDVGRLEVIVPRRARRRPSDADVDGPGDIRALRRRDRRHRHHDAASHDGRHRRPRAHHRRRPRRGPDRGAPADGGDDHERAPARQPALRPRTPSTSATS